MKHCLLSAFLFFSFSSLMAQNGQWTWMQGENLVPVYPVYGTRGLAAPLNKPGGRRDGSSWADSAGNVWIFGGIATAGSISGAAGLLNDLWKFDVSTLQWTWVAGDTAVVQSGIYGTQGVATPGNKPGSRQNSATWTDQSGDLWLFGGYGFHQSRYGEFNDLWVFHPSTSEWVWISGDSIPNQKGVFGSKGIEDPVNKPGGRKYAIGWSDNTGNFWLFGGNGYAANTYGVINDVWRFSTSTGQWTWIHGDSTSNLRSVYGKKGVASAANKPGGRASAVGTRDASGNLWLFGGSGANDAASGTLNELWNFSVSTAQWTWISGNTIFGQPVIYGTRNVPDSANKPGGRTGGVGWTDIEQNFWVWGGYGGSSTETGNLNDLWRFTPSTSLWTWMGGDTLIDQSGKYGTRGLGAAFTRPGARTDGTATADGSGNLWLFGGLGYSEASRGLMNDLWNYVPSTGEWTWVSGDNNHLGYVGIYNNKGVASALNSPGGRSGAASGTDVSGTMWMFGGSGFSADSRGTLNDLWQYSVSANAWIWISGDTTANQPGIYGLQGVPGQANKPASRTNAVSWTDAAGNFWVFGGDKFLERSGGYSNELWKYTSSSRLWTWMGPQDTLQLRARYGTKGVADVLNHPGARQLAGSWTDLQGNLWLFGGHGYATGFMGRLNDLWKYTPANQTWTWVSGDSLTNQGGNYGTKGVASSSNKPGGREGITAFTDATGSFWLFGGFGSGPSRNAELNDLWKYVPSAGTWTWMNGEENRTSSEGNYGKKDVPAETNQPPARLSAARWSDGFGNLWMFGGTRIGEGTSRPLQDLWKYSISSGLWTWSGGDREISVPGIYGQKEVASTTNLPGGRFRVANWIDLSGNLWLFGGLTNNYDFQGYKNDMWRYSLTAVSLPVVLSNFTGRLQNKTVLLTWNTAREQNSSHFIIERSGDGIFYDSISMVKASGTTNYPSSYFFIDKRPLQGNNIYRLNQVDKDGKFLYSASVKVATSVNVVDFEIAQNPVQSVLHLNIYLPHAQKLIIQLRDMSGKLVLSEQRFPATGTAIYSIPVQGLATGSYVVSIQAGNLNKTKAFIKQ